MHPECVAQPDGGIRRVAVVVPARDEAATLARSLRSIDDAIAELPIPGVCIVVLDSCRDDSAGVITDTVPDLRSAPIVVITRAGSAGAARDLGTRTALQRLQCDPQHLWLANTDADTCVPADWLTAQVELANHGAAAVAGIVELDHDVDERLRVAFGATYARGSDGTHAHVHGANLGVRADLLGAVGGWRHLRTGEDHDLWNRLTRIQPCVSSTAVTVRTSGRLVGRAPHGFARDLATIAQNSLTVA